MSDIKILQAILDGQVAIRSDIKKMEEKLSKGIKENGERIDKLGSQLAYLEDDAPTREEYNGLEKRVGAIEHKIA